MNSSVLVCQDLGKTFNDGVAKIDILSEVNLAVKKGELIAIVGNSGSGKSTLLHLLGGLDTPTKGKVILNGQNLATLSENEKCYARNNFLGFIYQFHHLQPEFSALENVCMPLLIRGVSRQDFEAKAEQLLASVGLKERLHHRPNQLSGGERQRVAIARAMVTDPLCILADEPTGDLDPRNAAQVFELFLQLQESHQTSVVMVTHDIGLAKKAQRVLTLDHGYLVEALVQA